MKRVILFVIASVLSSLTVSAQYPMQKGTEGYLPDGRRILTMEQAVLGTGIRVERKYIEWNEDSSYEVLPGLPKTANKDITFTKGNNLYYLDKEGTEHAVTSFSDPQIVCGQTVSRNEFGIDGGVFVSPDSSRIAFYRKDERLVTDYPLVDITSRTGSLVSIKYPMNGMPSEKVSVGVFSIEDGSTVWLDVTDFTDERYLTNVTWSPDSRTIYLQVLDRAQKQVHLNSYCAASGKFISTLLVEEDDRYVEPQYKLEFLESDPGKFLYCTNVRDGFWNLYLCSADGSADPVRLTDVDADVEYLCQRGKWIYYYSFEISPVERHLFRVNLKNRRRERLTSDEGWHTCTVSPDGKWFEDRYSALNVPFVLKCSSTDGKKSELLYVAEDPAADLNYCPIELGSIKSADGKYDNWYRLIKPLDFDPSKRYPVILYVYGGPHSQMVDNSFHAKLRTWEMYMAQHGYIVFVMDNRGTSNHGADYEKAIHKQCGKAEMADQMEGMKWLLSHSWADAQRVGVHGWSYGGFMTISLLTNYPDVFKVAVAGGPVIDWKWYEVMYGERYMETEETNPEGFAATSLIPMAGKVRGKLLICQGAIDNTVVWQHSLNFIEACIKNRVPVDYFPYPTHEHNVVGPDRVHLMWKVTSYFEDYL